MIADSGLVFGPGHLWSDCICIQHWKFQAFQRRGWLFAGTSTSEICSPAGRKVCYTFLNLRNSTGSEMSDFTILSILANEVSYNILHKVSDYYKNNHELSDFYNIHHEVPDFYNIYIMSVWFLIKLKYFILCWF